MTVTARVTVTMDIVANSSWSDKVEADQVYSQAKESALGQLSSLPKEIRIDWNSVKVIGVTASIAEPKK